MESFASGTPWAARRARHPAPLSSALLLVLLGAGATAGVAQEEYRLPPQEIIDILDAPRAPMVSVSPDRGWLAFAYRENMPALSDLAQPMLRLAGRRINPRTNGFSGASLVHGFSVMRVSDGSEHPVAGLPSGTGYGPPSFSPDGSHFTFTRTTDDGIELWIAEVREARARRLVAPVLNGTRPGSPCTWTSDSESLLCHLVPSERGAPPEAPETGGGPVIQEGGGTVAPVRTYQDLLQNAHDADLYDYYMTSQPTWVNATSGSLTPVGSPGVYSSITISPSGRYLLVRERVRPYSYLLPEFRFPEKVEVRDRSGRLVRRVAEVPLGDAIPIGGVQTGPRSFEWLTGREHTLTYVEALDGGDPRREVAERDRVLTLDAPFDGRPFELFRTAFRYGGLTHGQGGLAFLNEIDRPSRTVRSWRVHLDRPGERTLLWERNYEDRYGDPGSPVMEPDGMGGAVMVQRGSFIFLQGAGASDEGDRPFLDRMDLETGETLRLFRSSASAFESFVAFMDDDVRRILIRHESPSEPPNYSVLDVESGLRISLTDFPDPAPQLSEVTKEVLVYERADGIQLTGTLYLPPGYDGRERLPAVVWAYPREYSSADIASQVRGSPNRFTGIGGTSHLFFLTQGYAVLDGAEMPIVGGDTANNNYVEQLVASAQAAVDKIVELGVADRNRIGVGGHSYGAFMTANLLAHSDIFAAGIARSGAYNRTLTPFGFQAEQRTFWEAPEVYSAMSPFMHADRIQAPMLLIHGMIDNNSGTFPIQSERMYQAMTGHGRTARLVMLPHESHGYQARESVLHVLAEMLEWFDRFVKEAPDGRVTLIHPAHPVSGGR